MPSLSCGFNDSAAFCHEPGNVIDGCRGRFIKTVTLSQEQYHTLREWRDIEFDYRKREEIVRRHALKTCFGGFRDVNSSEKYELDWRFRHNYQPFRDDSPLLEEYDKNFMKEIIYQLMGLHEKPLVVRILLDNERLRYRSACKIQRNLRILYLSRRKNVPQLRRSQVLLLTDGPQSLAQATSSAPGGI